jgi:hypothetical protein
MASHEVAVVRRALLVAAVSAAVVAPERELRRWFSWRWYWSDSLIDDLVGDGRIRRIDGYVARAHGDRP